MDGALARSGERRPEARWLRLARRWALGGVGALVLALGLLGVPLVSALLMDSLQIFPAISDRELASAAADPRAAIVILSAGRRSYAPEFGGETLDALSLERARYGALLAKKTGLPVLVSGGLGAPDHPPLADLIADALARDFGVTVKWRETQSRTTAENAIYSSQILKRDKIDRVLLVTHAWHMRRSRIAFLANNLSVIPAPTGFYRPQFGGLAQELIPSFRAFRASGYAVHEIVGRWWYALYYGY